jgi:hypothetical protein
LSAKKRALLAKFAEMLGMTPEPPRKKPGPKPGATYRPRRGRKPGPKPRAAARAGRRGRRAGVGETLPAMIVAILAKAGGPLGAGRILERLQQRGWKTVSGDPKAMVYKTLHRIEKLGMIVKTERGKFTAPK